MSVLGHPQDLGGHGRQGWDGDVHVVPGGHGEQGGDLSRGHTEVSLRTDGTLELPAEVSDQACSAPGVSLTCLWSARSPSGVCSGCGASPFFSHPPLWSLT